MPTTITDLVARGRARVLRQYRALTTRFLPLLDVFTGEAQELEDALWGFVAQLDVATATDIWLDRLGSVVGEDREGETDTVYRRLIQARILANRSSGTDEEIIAITLTALGSPGGIALAIRDMQPASIELIVTGYVFAIDAAGLRLLNRVRRLLSITRAAGVRFMVITEPINESTSFKFSSTGALVLSARGFADANNLAAAAGHFRNAFVA